MARSAARRKSTNPSYKEPIAKGERDPYGPLKGGAYDQVASDATETPADAERERRYAIFAATVDQRIRDAQQARQNSGIEEIWDEDADSYDGVDELSAGYSMVKTRDQVAKVPANDQRSKVFVNITCAKTDIGVSRVQEMLLPSDGQKPWDVEHTPIPEIDEAIQGQDGTPVRLSDGATATRAAIAMMVREKAREAAKNMGDWIEDQFVEQLTYRELRHVLQDAGRKGTGCLKGPFPVEIVERRWVAEGEDYRLTLKKKIVPTAKRIRIEDIYPDPACGMDIHKGAYIVERQFATDKDLRGLAVLPDYDRQAIVAALKEGPRTGAKSRDPNRRELRGESAKESDLYELFHYFADCTPDDLELLMERGNDRDMAANDDNINGMAIEPADAMPERKPRKVDALLSEEEKKYLSSVPCMVTMLNGRPIKATLNPMESGAYPYHLFVWDGVDGQPWGRGIPFKIATAQKILNASMRAMLENAGMSSGPQLIITAGMVTPWDTRYEVRGRKGWYFHPRDGMDDVNKAMAVFDIPSVQEQMQAMVKLALDTADILTNMPMLMQGDQQAGTSPETLGGMKLLFNNAMSPLRTRARTFDDRLMGPFLRQMFDWGMEHGPANIKGDSQCKTKGSTAMIQREEGREFLMQVFPVKDDPKLRIDPIKLIQEMARSNGFDMSSVQYTEEEWKAIEAKAQQSPPPQEPAVQVAEIRAKATIEAAQLNAKDSEANRAYLANEAELSRRVEIELEKMRLAVQEMVLAGKQNISLTEVKAMLAKSAMDNRMATQEMNLKLDPENASHLGI